MTQRTVVVVGGGAAGLMAAGQAARSGARTLLLEKMKRPGLKLGLTGKGRCNITNVAEMDDFLTRFGPSGRFLRQAFARFFNQDLLTLCRDIGLDPVTERGGRVFFANAKATDVGYALLRWLNEEGVKIHRETAVDRLLIEQGRIVGVAAAGRRWSCDAVVLATGGASYPATGSTGDGYDLAQAVGHRLLPIRPALVPLETAGDTAGDTAGRMAGLTLRNIRARLLIDGKKARDISGELTFAEYGLTGPVVLTLSGQAVDALRAGHRVEMAIDLKPALDEKKLDARLLRDLAARGKEPCASLLRGLLPREIVPVCLDQAQVPPERTGANVTARERRRLRLWLKDLRLPISGHRPLSEAIVTAGGVDTREIDPRTMESRLVRGLYLAGEVLDLQADTGGYNLQAAFSTGWLAGRCAARADDGPA
jgi:hypothetical protein